MKKLIKIILIVGIIFNALIINIDNTYAATSYSASVNDRDGLNIRDGAGTNNNFIAYISYGSTVTLVSSNKYQGEGCSDGWYQINYAGETNRYICSTYVDVSGNDTNTGNGYYTTDSWGARVNDNYVNVRSGPSTGYTILDCLNWNTKVNILEESGDWYKISYYAGKQGYINKAYVTKYENITTKDASLNEKFKSAGFPESYWPFLSYLQKKHPSWTFKADYTNKDFSTAVNAETGKNYTQSTNDAYRSSANAVEAGTWYIASSGFVATYLDPRSYLNEENIFAFESLSYDASTQTSSVVSNIFQNSWMNNNEIINYYMNAGKAYNVSPVHLAARSKQEGMTNQNYVAITGTASSVGGLYYDGKNLDGVYNFFNIGAYGDNPVKRGIAVAKGYVGGCDGTPWDTKEKAIMYGALFIADGYINAGQDTLYYEKFNTSSKAHFSPYTHQYMTNVGATYSESISTYYSYKNAGLLDTAFTFTIPVYDNMPDGYTILPPIGDTNNKLSELKVNGNNITGFDSDVVEYTTYVPNNTTSISLTGTLSSSSSSVVGLGNIAINSDTTTAKVIVTSQTGEDKIYIITIVKEKQQVTPETPSEKPDVSDENTETPPKEDVVVKSPTVEEIVNKVDIKYSNGYMTYIDVGTTATTLINKFKAVSASSTITVTDSSGNTKTNSSLATGDKITIKSGEDSKTYIISIKGDNNGDGLINAKDLLRVQKHILGYSKLADCYADASDNNYDGVINAKDLLRIQKYILGYSTFK